MDQVTCPKPHSKQEGRTWWALLCPAASAQAVWDARERGILGLGWKQRRAEKHCEIPWENATQLGF